MSFRRQVHFEKGYNYLHETGHSRRGQHGMQIRFLLIGPEGATQFLMFTGWTPLGEVDADRKHHEPVHIDKEGLRVSNFGTGDYYYGLVRAPSGFDLGYHWLHPTYAGQEDYGPCRFLNSQTCYYDGSGLKADEVLLDFMSNGESAVWRHLVKRYRRSSEEAAAYAQQQADAGAR